MTVLIKNHPLDKIPGLVGGKGAGLTTLNGLLETLIKSTLNEMSGEPRFRQANKLIRPLVPNANLLTSGHYISYISKGDIRDAIASGNYKQICDAIAITPITDKHTKAAAREMLILDQNGEPIPVAVRSSASCEDASSTSPFAGDFSTFFTSGNNLDVILAAIRDVFKSMFNPLIIEKMLSFGLDPAEHYMGVCLQHVLGNKIIINTKNGPLNIYLPIGSAVIESKSIGMTRPEGVERTDPFIRLGFGLGTAVVGTLDEVVPCSVIFHKENRTFSFDEGRIIGFGAPDGQVLDPGRAGGPIQQYSKKQGEFDALSLGVTDSHLRIVTRLSLRKIPDIHFFTNQNLRDIFSIRDGEGIHHGTQFFKKISNPRATFMRFTDEIIGKLVIEFLGRVTRRIREELGLEVNLEVALSSFIEERAQHINLGFVQLRPFGQSGAEPIQLSKVKRKDMIAETLDCIGHGVYEFNQVILVTKDASGSVDTNATSQNTIANFSKENSGEFLILGPNIMSEIGRGGAYASLFNPGLIISYNVDGFRMAHPGTHGFTNIQMMRVIETTHESLKPAIKRLSKNPKKLAKGIFLIKTPVRVELDDTTGRGQTFFINGDTA